MLIDDLVIYGTSIRLPVIYDEGSSIGISLPCLLEVSGLVFPLAGVLDVSQILRETHGGSNDTDENDMVPLVRGAVIPLAVLGG